MYFITEQIMISFRKGKKMKKVLQQAEEEKSVSSRVEMLEEHFILIWTEHGKARRKCF